MADRDRPTVAQPERRLGVLPNRRTGCCIPAMGDGQRPAKARQTALIEDLGNEAQLLVQHELLAVTDRDACRFLAAVLEREDPECGDSRGICAGHHRTEDAAHG